ncbi:MAG: hypothetical protein AAF799_41080 [Myxococcota bacterium]
MSTLALALSWPLLVAPASPAQQPPSTAPTEETGAPAYDYVEQAPLDVETLIADSSRDYLDARARLEAHPELAAEAILDRLSTVPPPTSTDRKRLLDVLAALGLPDHVEMFATELRRGVERADSSADEAKALKQWLPLLTDQGEAALPALSTLVADKKMPMSIRASLLDAMVDATPPSRVAELVVLVGRGARPLRQQLQRSLKRRGRRETEVWNALVASIDEALADAEPRRAPLLLELRGALSPDDDAFVSTTLTTIAEDSEAPFTMRVTALRSLGNRESAPAHEALVRVAETALAPESRETQRGEVLAWLALEGLPEASAKPLIERYELASDDAPRLAAIGFAWAPLPADHVWLAPALENPWPQVRQAALARVQGPCSSSTTKFLEQRAHLAGRRSEDDRAVARSTIQALGRCTASDRLQRLLNDEDLDLELRSEAARQLARLGDDDSIEAIGRVLGRNPERAFARRLARALRHMPKPTATGDEILCDAAQRPDEAGHAARESLIKLHPVNPAAACEDE